MGRAKTEQRGKKERERGRSKRSGWGAGSVAERNGQRRRKLQEKRSRGTKMTIKHKRCCVFFKRLTPAGVKGHLQPTKDSRVRNAGSDPLSDKTRLRARVNGVNMFPSSFH